MAQLVKNINGVVYSSVKSRNGVAVASIKNINGIDVTPSGSPAITYTDTAVDTNDLSSYTFTARSIGTAAADRRIIVGIFARSSVSTTIAVSGVTVAGITAAVVPGTPAGGPNGSVSTETSLWIVDVPTGTTGDIVVTLNNTGSRCAIALWSATGIVGSPSDVATYFVSGSNNTISLNADVLTGSIVVAIGGCNSSAVTMTWTGATEDVDAAVETSRYTAASHLSVGAETPRTFTATLSGNAGDRTGSLAVFN